MCSSSGLISYINNIYSVIDKGSYKDGNFKGVIDEGSNYKGVIDKECDNTPLTTDITDITSLNNIPSNNTPLPRHSNNNTPLNNISINNTPLPTPITNNTPTTYPFITSVILNRYYYKNYTYIITPFTLYIVYKGYLLYKINKKITSFNKGILGTRDGYIITPLHITGCDSMLDNIYDSILNTNNSMLDNTYNPLLNTSTNNPLLNTSTNIHDNNPINYLTFKVCKDALTGILLYNKGIYITSRDGYLYYINNKEIYEYSNIGSIEGVSNSRDILEGINKIDSIEGVN
ncbi:hypothetical protein CWI39_3655p0010, partial [Hamiltosporidium magnivora]